MEGKKVKRFVLIDLTDEEVISKSKELGELGLKLGVVEEEKKSVTSDYSAKITTLKETMKDYFNALSERKEHREEECIETKNFESNTVEWYYNDVVVDSRVMLESDRQQDLV